MQQTIDFENELHRRYPPLDENGEEVKGNPSTKQQIKMSGGKVEVTPSGSVEDIKEKYSKKPVQKAEDAEESN